MSSFYGCCGGSGSGGGSGTPGVGIKTAIIDENGQLVLTYTNGTVNILGKVVGNDGVTFTPHMAGTVLYWTNNGGLVNPDPIDLATADSTVWENLEDLMWGDIDGNVPAETSSEYVWETF